MITILGFLVISVAPDGASLFSKKNATGASSTNSNILLELNSS